MSATTTKGLETYLTQIANAPTAIVPTAITSAKPAVVTAAGMTVADGDVLYCDKTGFKELDGKYFIAGTASAVAVTLVGSDTSGTTDTLATTPSIDAHALSDMTRMCLATVDPAVNTPGTTSVGTFCDPSATVPAVAQAGTLTMTGFVEDSEYYDELNLAVEDGIMRVLNVVLPQGLGNIVVPATLSSIGWQLPVDGAIGFTVSGAMGTNPKHRY